MEVSENSIEQKPDVKGTIRVISYIAGTFLLFYFAVHLMQSSFHELGSENISSVLRATNNPFTAFFIGLIITAIIQSSSTTTAFVVALVATGSLAIQNAIPVIMGANVGTTITGIIVSLAFISKKKEFRRAVSASLFHCFFNLLTLIILFPLEYYYKFLSSLSLGIAKFFLKDEHRVAPINEISFIDHINSAIIHFVNNGIVLIVLSFLLIFGSILLFRRIISNIMKAQSPEAFSRFFFRSRMKSLGWGLITTAAIRSSTITTSVVVPIVAKKLVSLRQAAPFIMGANVGTTITAFIAVLFNNNTTTAVSIAIAHFLFNFMGVALFFPPRILDNVLINLASQVGKFCSTYRIAIFIFVLLTFFLIPFALIFVSINY